MDEKQITEIVAKTVGAVLDARDVAAADAKKKADEAAAQAAPVKPVFEGDPSKPEDVQKHLAKIEAAKVDWTNPEAVKKHLDGLTAKAPQPGVDPEVARLELQLENTQKALNAAKGGSNMAGGGSAGLAPEGTLTYEEEIQKGFEQAALATVEAGGAKDVKDVEAPGFLF